jgi:hypothetical protein
VSVVIAVVVQTAVTALTFATIAEGRSSGVIRPDQRIVRTQADWETLWSRHMPDGAPPPVDFAASMVAAVFLGERPTSGFRVEIAEIRATANEVVVEYVERRPAPGDMTAQVLTNPFHIVRAPRAEGPVRFVRRAP